MNDAFIFPSFDSVFIAYYRESNYDLKGHFRTFYRKKFLSTIINGQFHVGPEILSRWVKRGQEVIWSDNNPTHNLWASPILELKKDPFTNTDLKMVWMN